MGGTWDIPLPTPPNQFLQGPELPGGPSGTPYVWTPAIIPFEDKPAMMETRRITSITIPVLLYTEIDRKGVPQGYIQKIECFVGLTLYRNNNVVWAGSSLVERVEKLGNNFAPVVQVTVSDILFQPITWNHGDKLTIGGEAIVYWEVVNYTEKVENEINATPRGTISSSTGGQTRIFDFPTAVKNQGSLSYESKNLSGITTL